MKITYRYSAFEYVLMHFYTMPRMPFVKYLFIGLIVINIFLNFGSSQNIVIQVITALVGAALVVAVGLAVPVLIGLLSRRTFIERTTVFDEEGVAITHSDKELKASWASFLKMHISDNFIYIKMDNGCHLVIPRRVFTDKSEENQCIELIGTKLKHA